ncbi:MAG TPA: phospholipase D-like domain-containing protein [Ktedonobacteraceae bacterium]|nr:phospholipase D-like domain-containing protein [Ktedonobacteraceae bacterium]
MQHISKQNTIEATPLKYLVVVSLALCILLAGCTINISLPTSSNSSCVSNCTTGPGVQGVSVFVEPNAGEHPITDAIRAAKKSVWLEIYILTDRNVISALEEAANKGVDVRVMLEPHPFGGGSPARTLDQLRAAGVKVQDSSPSFSLTHEKGMIIDGTTAYIMTSNFSRSALGAYSSSSSFLSNREYDIVDTNAQDVQAVSAIFQADWNRTTAQFNDPNLVVSPVNSRNTFIALINSAHSTLLIEAEEMNDTAIEQALANAAQHGVQIQVILPAPQGSSSDSNSQGIASIKQGGVQVKEDPHLYMHAKIIVVDGQKAFVGSENISTQSLDQNRELGIIVSDQGVLHTLQQTFQQDWGASHGV